MNSIFAVGRDLRRLVLEAVARADLDDRDPLGHRHGSGSSLGRGGRFRFIGGELASGSPRATWSPTATSSRATRPADGAAMTCSIFIASRTIRGWVAATSSPAATWIRTIRPGIGAVMAPPSPARPPGRWSRDGGGSRRTRCARPAIVTVSTTRRPVEGRTPTMPSPNTRVASPCAVGAALDA